MGWDDLQTYCSFKETETTLLQARMCSGSFNKVILDFPVRTFSFKLSLKEVTYHTNQLLCERNRDKSIIKSYLVDRLWPSGLPQTYIIYCTILNVI